MRQVQTTTGFDVFIDSVSAVPQIQLKINEDILIAFRKFVLSSLLGSAFRMALGSADVSV
jgi:hypothetical protein